MTDTPKFTEMQPDADRSAAEIRPLRIAIPQSDLDDLKERLARTRWLAMLPGGAWRRGVPVAYLKQLVEYWRDGYDWRAHEARLNAFPQFTTEIDGQTIHFLYVRSPEPEALPLILTHSWPSSFDELTDLIRPLADPRSHGGDPATAFHVVVPSLPGFAFSGFPEPADERPWSAARVARCWAELMRRLGYERYGAHGNDAGALVSQELAVAAPEYVVGIHITGGVGMPTSNLGELEGLGEEERAEVEFLAGLLSGGTGYAAYLSSRPQTLAYGFHDSPVFQLAYLLERFKEFDGWPDGEEEVPEPIDRDRLLTNASLYWFTRTGGSSAWTYYDGAAGMPIDQALVPMGVSHGGSAAFRRIAEKRNDIVHWSNLESGSHMVALSVPDALLADLRAFFALLGRGA